MLAVLIHLVQSSLSFHFRLCSVPGWYIQLFSFLPSLSLQQFYLFLRKQLFASEVMTTAVTVLSDAQCVCVYAA